MRFHAVRTNPNFGRAAAHRRLQNVGVEYDMDHRGLYEELRGATLPQSMNGRPGGTFWYRAG